METKIVIMLLKDRGGGRKFLLNINKLNNIARFGIENAIN